MLRPVVELLIVLGVTVAVALPVVLVLRLRDQRDRYTRLLVRLDDAEQRVRRLGGVEVMLQGERRRNTDLRESLDDLDLEMANLRRTVTAHERQRDEARSYARHYRTRLFEHGIDANRNDPAWITP